MILSAEYESKLLVTVTNNSGSDCEVTCHSKWKTEQGLVKDDPLGTVIKNGVTDQTTFVYLLPPKADLTDCIVSMRNYAAAVHVAIQYYPDAKKTTYPIAVMAGWLKNEITSVYQGKGLINGNIVPFDPYALYEFKTEVTQHNAGATDIGILMTLASKFVPTIVMILAGTFAVGRVVNIDINDATPVFLGRFAGATLTTGQQITGVPHFVLADDAATTVNAIGINVNTELTAKQLIRFAAAALAEHEAITFYICGKLYGDKPTTAVIGANAVKADAYEYIT